ncbi:MAG: peptidoglycan DD-metalloendopeptidase family protein [Bacteroidota bacterium]|nr:peptidoglycan DD-metalloendopeptidase family protein [Bacteroidota bacterium]
MIQLLQQYQHIFHPVVLFNPAKEKLLLMDFTEKNKTLSEEIFSDTEKFSQYIDQQLIAANAKYGIGGYDELRTVYARSNVFDTSPQPLSFREGQEAESINEPRRLHLGIDIWGKTGTTVFAPFGGVIHSFAFNDHYGDYGATIILQHQIKAFTFFTLYGHLSLRDIQHLKEGKFVSMGEEIGHFGEVKENGNWPPHLHFQIIIDMQNCKGDYPGVCKLSEREKYLINCPDPDIILQLMKFAK